MIEALVGITVGAATGLATVQLAAAELDPNQLVIVFGSILVAWITVQGGVTIRTAKRVKGVQENLSTGTPDGVGAELIQIAKRIDRVTVESDERWKLTLGMSDVVSTIHSNQVVALSAAQDLMKDVAAMKQAQLHHDQRMTLLESHTTDKLARLESTIAELQRRIEALGRTDPLTPPHGIPVTT